MKPAKKKQVKRPRGRPLSGDEPRQAIEVTLPPAVIDRLRKLGKGNVSRGIELVALAHDRGAA